MVLALGTLAAVYSCKDMDLKPYNDLEKSQSLTNFAQARYYNNGTYVLLKGRTYGLFTFSQDVQADQLNASFDFGNRNGFPHRMDDTFLAGDYTIRDTYQPYYVGINNANNAIENYPGVPTTTAAQADSIKKFIGNSHLARAFYYHQLALRFCKDYNPATAATDLGMPLVLKSNINGLPSRASLKATYDQILSDIAIAKTNLANVPGGAATHPSRSRFTIDAVLAMEARVKLDYHDYDGAYTAAKAVIDKGLYTLYNTAANVKAYWHEDARQEDILQLFADKSALSNTNGGIYLGFNSGTGRFSPDFFPTQAVIDLYDNADLRKAVYFENKVVLVNATIYNNTLKLVNKFPGNPALFTGATTNYQHKVKVFRIAEQYLIAAEAAFMKTASDETNARFYLNALRVARGLGVTNATGAALLQEIKDERQRELAFEGFRLFDLKRWGSGVKRGAVQNLNVITKTPAGSFYQLDVPANYDKIVWGIPNYEIIVNPSLKGQQNQGW